MVTCPVGVSADSELGFGQFAQLFHNVVLFDFLKSSKHDFGGQNRYAFDSKFDADDDGAICNFARC